MERKARIFISCGQTRGGEEQRIANQVAERLSQLGFEPYIAVNQQTLVGLKENTFKQLELSEYFLFMDFKREPLGAREGAECRGSLFSHQELAVASYLKLPVLALQEEGVKRDDGIMGFIQGNSISFSDRHLLPAVVADEVQKRKWEPKLKNELVLSRDADEWETVRDPKFGKTTYFHINVKNNHSEKLAINCYAYVESVYDLNSGQDHPIQSAELKWAGFKFPNACVLPKSNRKFDAGAVALSDPSRYKLSAHADSQTYMNAIEGPGSFRIRFVVVSETFATCRIECDLTIGTRMEDIRLVTSS